MTPRHRDIFPATQTMKFVALALLCVVPATVLAASSRSSTSTISQQYLHDALEGSMGIYGELLRKLHDALPRDDDPRYPKEECDPSLDTSIELMGPVDEIYDKLIALQHIWSNSHVEKSDKKAIRASDQAQRTYSDLNKCGDGLLQRLPNKIHVKENECPLNAARPFLLLAEPLCDILHYLAKFTTIEQDSVELVKFVEEYDGTIRDTKRILADFARGDPRCLRDHVSAQLEFVASAAQELLAQPHTSAANHQRISGVVDELRQLCQDAGVAPPQIKSLFDYDFFEPLLREKNAAEAEKENASKRKLSNKGKAAEPRGRSKVGGRNCLRAPASPLVPAAPLVKPSSQIPGAHPNTTTARGRSTSLTFTRSSNLSFGKKMAENSSHFLAESEDSE